MKPRAAIQRSGSTGGANTSGRKEAVNFAKRVIAAPLQQAAISLIVNTLYRARFEGLAIGRTGLKRILFAARSTYFDG